MKTKLLALMSGILIGCAGELCADIKVNLPQENSISQINYVYAPIKQYSEAKSRNERGLVTDSVAVSGYSAVLPIPTDKEGYLYYISFGDDYLDLYAAPGDNIEVNVSELQPLDYTLSGTPLADAMNILISMEKPIEARHRELSSMSDPDREAINSLYSDYILLQKNYIKENPDSPALLLALMNLEGEDFVELYDSVAEKQKGSILYPLALKKFTDEQRSLELERRQQAMVSGEIEAPGFTLKDMEGKDVSLSDFRGKWVILDFWGSWCIWCIRGIPELKEAYEKYSGRLEIIGIDCNESQEAWRAGVEKYELPWVNVYNPEGSSLTEEYGVQGFPTKAIVDPEGKIRNVTTGHDPNFYKVLSGLMGE